MKLGFVSGSLEALSFEAMLDTAARMVVSGVEVNTCGWATASFLAVTKRDVEPAAGSHEGLVLQGALPGKPTDCKPQDI